MDSPEFRSLGFTTDNPRKLLADAVSSGGLRGMQKIPGFDLIGAYTDPSKARLSLVRRTGHEVSILPSLISTQSYRAEVYRLKDQLAHVKILDADEVEFLAIVDDPTQYPLRLTTESVTVENLTIGAICVRAEIYEDEDDFACHRPESDKPWSSRTIACPSIAAEGLIEVDDLSPRAIVGFRVEQAQTQRNSLTGKKFYYGTGISRIRFAFAMPPGLELEDNDIVLGTFTLVASSGLWDRP